MINAISSAISGMLGASQKVDAAAQNIARAPVSSYDMIEDIVDIKVAETAFKANIAVLKTANELSDELLRLFDKRV